MPEPRTTLSPFVENLVHNGKLQVTWACNEESNEIFEEHGLQVDRVVFQEYISGLLALQVDWSAKKSTEESKFKYIRKGAEISGRTHRNVELEFFELPYTHVFKDGVTTFQTCATLDVGVELGIPEDDQSDPTLHLCNWMILGIINTKYGATIYFAPPTVLEGGVTVYDSATDEEWQRAVAEADAEDAVVTDLREEEVKKLKEPTNGTDV